MAERKAENRLLLEVVQEIHPRCMGCYKRPSDIDEYVAEAAAEEMSPDDFVRHEEGTYNRSNGHFLCTKCYIEAGSPSSSRGWVCP